MQGIFDGIISFGDWLLGTGRPVLAVCIGLSVSWSVTQFVKMNMDLSHTRTTVLAFILATAATYMATPGWWSFDISLSFATGLAAPYAYKFLVNIGRARGWSWVDSLSSDKKKP